MAIITLTTDMGTRDHYVAVVKGAILSQLPDVTIVDVTHGIKPFDNAQAAFVLRNAYPAFPAGTIHVIGVNPELQRNTVHVVVVHKGHYFVCADNGILPLMIEGQPDEAFELTMKLDNDHVAFPVRSVFVNAACHLARGGTPATIGRRMGPLREQIIARPLKDRASIQASIVHIDSYGNLMTNVRRELFDEVGRGRRFIINFGRSADEIKQIHTTYTDVNDGQGVAFFNASGHLEIAINKGVDGHGGSAAGLMGMRVHDTVRIDFAERAENRVTAQQPAVLRPTRAEN